MRGKGFVSNVVRKCETRIKREHFPSRFTQNVFVKTPVIRRVSDDAALFTLRYRNAQKLGRRERSTDLFGVFHTSLTKSGDGRWRSG